MKENSIERDIHLLESYAGMTHKMTDNQGRPKLDQAIERVLLDYKRVLKENEELKKSKITYEKVRDIQEKNKNIVDNNYIPKQKIKDKIEEINKMIAYEHNDAVIIQLGKQKRVLQKLLESED